MIEVKKKRWCKRDNFKSFDVKEKGCNLENYFRGWSIHSQSQLISCWLMFDFFEKHMVLLVYSCGKYKFLQLQVFLKQYLVPWRRVCFSFLGCCNTNSLPTQLLYILSIVLDYCRLLCHLYIMWNSLLNLFNICLCTLYK